MSYPFAVTFLLSKEGKKLEISDEEYVELPHKLEVGLVSDTCEPYIILQNIECIDEIEKLGDGEYDILLAGTWEYVEGSTDWESQVTDYEVLIEHKMLSIQPHKEYE